MKRPCPRPRNPRRLLVMLLLLLTGGALVNVAVAWGCAVWSGVRTLDDRGITQRDLRWMAANDEQAGFDTLANEPAAGPSWFPVTHLRGFGVTWEQFPLHDTELVEAQTQFAEEQKQSGYSMFVSWMSYDVTSFESGLPLRSMASEFWRHTSDWERKRRNDSESGQDETRGGWFLEYDAEVNLPRLIPWHPIPFGFLINTVFYAAILCGVFTAPFALRRRRRVKRGLCPACAYPVGTNDLCTECGAAVPSPSR